MKTVQSTLANNPSYYEEVVKLIESSFHYLPENSFEVDFYTLIGPHNWENCHIIINPETKEVLGHIGIQKKSFCFGETNLLVAFIGGIAFKSEVRGKGLFKEFFKELLESLYKDNALVLLWSDKNELYNKFGFYEAGSVFEYKKSEYISTELKKTTLKEVSSSQFETIKRMHKEKSDRSYFHPERTKKDWEAIREITSASLYIKVKDEKILSYYFVGKGNDLTDICYEYAGEDKSATIKHLSGFNTWTPEKISEQREVLFAGLFKIGNEKIFSEFIHKISNAQTTIKKIDNDWVEFEHNNEGHKLSTEEYLQGLFGPSHITEFNYLSKPIWISGLDSI